MGARHYDGGWERDYKPGRTVRLGGVANFSAVLADLAKRERYLALEIQGTRYNIGVKYGLLTAQLALGLSGVDRDKILTGVVDLLATR